MNKFKKFFQGIFSIRNNGNRKIVTFLGIKLKLKNNHYYKEIEEAIEIQDNYDLSGLQKAEKLILFLTPNRMEILGGIMSIYYLCKFSRELKKDYLCLTCTTPGKSTYAKNDKFENNERIYRWEQIVNNGINIKELILHVPEYYIKKFYEDLRRNEIKFLKSIPNLHINILNQNIKLMPKPKNLKELYKLTSNITQTTGFESYTTQEVCDKYNIPLYHLASFIDLDNCIKNDYKNKKKLILYSLDDNPMKSKIVKRLQNDLSDFELRVINNLTYEQFLKLIADALFCISFGEGFDGYYIQPYYAKSIGISVYNDIFFINSEMKSFPFVYESYEQMYEKIADDINKVYQNKNEYEQISKNIYNYFVNHINKREKTISCLDKFYSGKPTFVPNIK